MIESLLNTEIARRDIAWELEFLRTFAKAPLSVAQEDTVQGPDGWPYLLVNTGGEESVGSVVQWLSTRGVGLVINPHKPTPDFVLSYGMIWNFRERGEFLTLTPPRAAGALEIHDGQRLFTGAPSEAYLPKYVRQVLREFFARQRVQEPRVLMVSANETDWDLAISIESLGEPPATEHAGIAEALSWFLPAHYSVALISERAVPGFVAL